jgi:hypothetical protein
LLGLCSRVQSGVARNRVLDRPWARPNVTCLQSVDAFALGYMAAPFFAILDLGQSRSSASRRMYSWRIATCSSPASGPCRPVASGTTQPAHDAASSRARGATHRRRGRQQLRHRKFVAVGGGVGVAARIADDRSLAPLAVDARNTRHPGYSVSQPNRKADRGALSGG